MKVLYDIDMVFFLDSERPLTECLTPKKTVFDPALLLRRLAKTPTFLHVEHYEALAAWDKENLRGLECWHFDAHADLGEGGARSPLLLPLGRRADHFNSGNFLCAALREGIISVLHWVLPPWMTQEDGQRHIHHLGPLLTSSIRCHTWNEAVDTLPSADRADISFSPASTPLEMLQYLTDFLPADQRGLDIFLDHLCQGQAQALNGLPHMPPFLEDVPTLPVGVPLFHGSRFSGLSILKGTPLYLSPSPEVACCFGLPLYSELGWFQGVNSFGASMPQVYLAFPPKLDKLLDNPMTLYETRGTDTCQPAGSMYGYEYASPCPFDVLKSRIFPKVRYALEEYGVHIGRFGEIRVAASLREAAFATRRETEAFFNMPLDAILALPILETSLLIFFVGVLGLPPKRFQDVSPVGWRRFLDRALLPASLPFMLQPDNEYHGLAHARETARLSCLLALREGYSPLAPMLAACLHDAARENDLPGEKHALDAAELAGIFLRHDVLDEPFFPLRQQEEVTEAIAKHASPTKASTSVGACLQDADRLRLAWESGPVPHLFSTASGLRFAQLGPVFTTNTMEFYDRLGDKEKIALECKFELTDACNMACSFCHQGFGSTEKQHVMAFEAYAQWITIVAEEGIRSVRLTGGEPTLVPDLAAYLAFAKEKGLHATLNTNAMAYGTKGWEEILPHVDCLKISLPAPDEAATAVCTGMHGLWEKKLEAAASAAAHRIQVEFLTPMVPAAIEAFDAFADLLEQIPFVRWLPLRAEPSPRNYRPVSREEMLCLLKKIAALRVREHWKNLMLYLAVPFCLLDSPQTAVSLLHGRQSCGPLSSLTIDPQGRLMRCYSRRKALDGAKRLRAAAAQAAIRDFEDLPETCRCCPVVYRCLGGCRCEQACGKGGFDYLARPDQAALWQKFRITGTQYTYRS